MKILLHELFGEDCRDLLQGKKLYGMIFPRLKNKESVELDFTGVKTILFPFLKEAFGRLMNYFEKTAVQQRLVFCNISPELLQRINEYIEHADRLDTHTSDRETLENLFEDDMLEEDQSEF